MTQKHSNTFIWTVVIAVVAAAAGLGYYTNSLQLREADAANVNANRAEASHEGHHHDEPQTPFDPSALNLRDSDIVIGRTNAPHTIVEYSSLSCPHCAHFHKSVLPEIKKELIDTGKAKHVIRYFPLNLPALRAATLTECAPKAKRLQLLETLYSKQDDWAFTPMFLDKLKEIGKTNGVDEAAFDSCIGNATIEARILNNRKEGMEKLHVSSTPTFFVNGEPLRLEGGLKAEAFINAIEAPKKQD